jgi:outer membrane biosynthesis protein TonB
MSDQLPRGRGRGPSLVWFLILSLLINAAGAYSGYFWHIPQPAPIVLTDIDINDVPPLGDPNVPEDQPQPPPDPEPTPPPDPEPTPPPLDKPPEFEIPSPTPTPTPEETPTPTPTPEETPTPTPTPEEKKSTPKPTATAKPTVHTEVKQSSNPNPSAHPNAAATPGVGHGSANGVKGGTGNGGPRSGKLIRSPLPPYPPQALQMHITGNCTVSITVSDGHITSAEPVSGPSILSSSAARWVRNNWQFAPGTNGTFTLPVAFVMH